MGTEEWQTYCPQCQAVRLGRRETPNHLLHFMVTILTCGFWAFVWIALTISASFSPYLCSVCGAKGVNR